MLYFRGSNTYKKCCILEGLKLAVSSDEHVWLYFISVEKTTITWTQATSEKVSIVFVKILGRFNRPAHMSTTSAHVSKSGQSFLRGV